MQNATFRILFFGFVSQTDYYTSFSQIVCSSASWSASKYGCRTATREEQTTQKKVPTRLSVQTNMGAECSSLGNTICSDCAAIRPGKKGGHENANTGATGPGEENHVKAEPQRETVAQAERRGFGKLEQQKAFATLQARGPVEGAQRNAARLDNAKLTAEQQALIAARASREAACNTAPGHHRPHHAVRHAAGVVHSHQPHQYDLQLYNLNQQHVVHHQAQQLCQTQQRQSQRFFPEIHHPARHHVHGSSQRRLIDEATGNQPGLRSSAFEVDAEEFQRNVLDHRGDGDHDHRHYGSHHRLSHVPPRVSPSTSLCYARDQ